MHPRRPWPILFTVLAALVGASLWGLWADRPRQHLEECQQNLKRISLALEVFSVDHHGLYPYEGQYPHPTSWKDIPPGTRGLGALVPRYLKAIPICPAARRDTYSETYLAWEDPEAYFFWCSGGYHAPSAYPAYDSVGGISLSLDELRELYGYYKYTGRPLPPGEPPLYPNRNRRFLSH